MTARRTRSGFTVDLKAPVTAASSIASAQPKYMHGEALSIATERKADTTPETANSTIIIPLSAAASPSSQRPPFRPRTKGKGKGRAHIAGGVSNGAGNDPDSNFCTTQYPYDTGIPDHPDPDQIKGSYPFTLLVKVLEIRCKHTERLREENALLEWRVYVCGKILSYSRLHPNTPKILKHTVWYTLPSQIRTSQMLLYPLSSHIG